jgi:hypothetical protein
MVVMVTNADADQYINMDMDNFSEYHAKTLEA